MSDEEASQPFPPVTETESGQKLLQCLERRLNIPANLLHRWIRTGQIRLNGKRCKPFTRLICGDNLRIPPFALKLAQMDGILPELNAPASENLSSLTLLDKKGDIWAIAKPAGLASQSGTGQIDSISARLAASFDNYFFKPALAHRLDINTSGILLVGASYEALRYLQENLRNGNIAKEYLAWIEGEWPYAEDILLKHFLRKEGEQGHVKIHAYTKPVPYTNEARCIVRPLRINKWQSLVHIRLLTGRTHQIRAQMAAIGNPLLGDSKYGTKAGTIYLHALRVILPDGHEFYMPPPWDGKWLPADIPLSIPGYDNLKIVSCVKP